jgi:hypothetical protein
MMDAGSSRSCFRGRVSKGIEAVKAHSQVSESSTERAADILGHDNILALWVLLSKGPKVGRVEAVCRPLTLDRQGPLAVASQHKVNLVAPLVSPVSHIAVLCTAHKLVQNEVLPHQEQPTPQIRQLGISRWRPVLLPSVIRFRPVAPEAPDSAVLRCCPRLAPRCSSSGAGCGDQNSALQNMLLTAGVLKREEIASGKPSAGSTKAKPALPAAKVAALISADDLPLQPL